MSRCEICGACIELYQLRCEECEADMAEAEAHGVYVAHAERGQHGDCLGVPPLASAGGTPPVPNSTRSRRC